MKWQTEKMKIGPKNNEKRIVKRFAWLPVDCKNNITVWLEWYWTSERYWNFLEKFLIIEISSDKIEL